MSSKAFYGIFKIFSFLLCFGLFLFLMLDVWQKYYDGMTNIGSRFDDQDEGKKSLPCVTFCPYSSFKKKGLFFKHEDFIQQTYEKEELFYNFHKSKLANKSLYQIEEVRGVFNGRCYMACYLPLVDVKEQVFIPLLKQHDIVGKIIFLGVFS